MTLRARIARKLTQQRLAGGLTQEEYARKLRITRGYLSDLERGQKSISIELLERICRKTGLASAELLGV